MDEHEGGGRGGRVMRWVAGAACAFGVAVVCLAASPASAAAGDLDGAFGTGGTVTTDFAGNGDEARAVAVQPDGKIVAAGGALGATVDFALVRYRPDGTLDATFGTGGKVTTDFGSAEQAFAVAVQPDGKIVVAGGAATGFELARYNADGSLDGTFGAGGKVTTRFGLGLPFTRAHAIVLQPDGKIVVAGTATSATAPDFGLARYNPNGSLDASFGAGGTVTTDIRGTDSSDAAWAVALQPDGKLVVAGSTAGPSGDAFALARYTPTGALDTTFGSSGRVITGFGGDQDWAQAVAVQADGKIVAAGKTGHQCCGGTFDFALARYTAGGTLDTTFGTGGKVTTDFAGSTDNAHALVIQADGKILAGGERLPGGNASGASFDFALARYQPGGALDPAFGAGGLVTTDFPGHNDHAYALALQQDGKVVAAGDSSPDFALARYAAATVNNPPAARDDSYATAEDTPLTVAAPGVLGNDSDADGDPLSVPAASVTAPAHGTAAVNADGSFTYTPAADFNGTDTFTYQASDGTAPSTAATVTITVTPVNDPPAAAADSATVAEDATTVIDVTANDAPGPANEAGQALSVSSVTQPAHGQAAILTGGADAGKVRYAPGADYNGPDSFTYTACDDGTTNGLADPQCDTATVTITVTPVNDPPAARDDNYATAEDTPLTVAAPGVLGNDSDADGDPVSVPAASVTAPAHGTAAVNADGSFTYTPAADFNGTDTFTYQASDGTAPSTAATVTITVTPVNDPPAARDDNYRTEEDTPLSTTASKMAGVLANDSDADGDPLTAVLVTGPAHGTLSLNSNGSFTYTPAANYNGTDTFTYQASDGVLTSDAATVTITVTPVPDAPIARVDSYRTGQDTPLTVPPPGALGNDSDADGDPLTAVLVTGPAHGTLSLNSNGSFTYTPAAGFSGTDSFTYRATDGVLGSNAATVTITVVRPGTPVAVDDSYRTGQDTPLMVPPPGVLANDSDPNGDPLRIEIRSVTAPAHGTLNLSKSDGGDFTYTPATGFTGQDSFTYRATDGVLGSNVATVTITVAPKIVFASTRDGNSEIYVMNSDGSGVTRLTTNPATDTTPVWSPNHRKIAFISTRDGNPRIYVMNADGTALTRLPDKFSGIDATPAWSPDGTKIAFAGRAGSNWDIYVMNADGTALTRLTSNPAIDATPAWAPGGKIAFASTRDKNSEIYLMPAAGEVCKPGCTAATRLTTNSATDTSPTWLGTRIAFASTRDDPNSEIYVMNADGTAVTRLTANPAADVTPAGSPDGQTIAFASTREDPNSEIYVMNADGTAVTRLTANPASDTFPDW